MAPEIVSKKEYRGDKADMWACGVVMYVLLTGYFPFKSQDEKGLFRKITKGIYPVPENASGTLSVEAQDLLQSLLRVDP